MHIKHIHSVSHHVDLDSCVDGDVKLAQQLITNGANVNWRNPLLVSNSCCT